MRALLWAMTVGFSLATWSTSARADEEKIALDQVPKPVMDAVKKKFPGAEIKQAEKEVEKDKTTYEIGLKHEGHNVDVSLKPDGTILEIEKEIAVKDLPAAVTKAINAKYAGAKIDKAEEIIEGDEVEYEVIVTTADKKMREIVLEPNGKIEEDEEAGKD